MIFIQVNLEYLLSSYCVLGTLLGTGDRIVNEQPLFKLTF